MMLGQASPAATYYPPHDECIPFAERRDAFHRWVTQYFQHGEPIAAETLALRDGLKEPSSTLDRVSEDELAECLHGEPGDLLSGSDTLTVKLCMVHGVFTSLKDGTFYLPPAQDEDGTDGWRDVEVRLMWCDQSIWTMVWGPPGVSKELKEAREAGRSTRNISFVRLRGANHFVSHRRTTKERHSPLYQAHWDFPEKTLRAFLGDEEEL